jgi:hypothetical protein
MTEHSPRATRWSKGRLRALAWLTGAITFVSSGIMLSVAPKPATASGDRPAKRPRVIRKVLIRRVVIVHPAASGSGATVASTSSSGGGSGGGGGGGTTAATTTGGS